MLFDFSQELADVAIVAIILFSFLKYHKKIKNAGLNINPISLKQAILTIIIVILVDLFFIWTTKPVEIANKFSTIKQLILSPIWEETLYRGAFLGIMPIVFKKVFDIKEKTKLFYFSFILVFIVQLLAFYIGHGGAAIVMINGLLYSVLFLYPNKNLFRSIIAHFSGNFLIILILELDLLSKITA